MGNLRLTLAVGDYDHTRDLALGRVRPHGIDLTVLNFNVEEISVARVSPLRDLCA